MTNCELQCLKCYYGSVIWPCYKASLLAPIHTHSCQSSLIGVEYIR